MTSRKAECQLESLSRPVSLPTRSPAHHSSKLLTRTARGNSQGAKNNRQQPDLQLLAFGEKDMDDDAPGCSLMEAAFAATLKHENQTFVASVQLQPGLYYSLPSPVEIVCLHCVRSLGVSAWQALSCSGSTAYIFVYFQPVCVSTHWRSATFKPAASALL